tara:strand:- start:5 stop:652 length:648 start_codon:yes stop_codon:yes gene_type:complete
MTYLQIVNAVLKRLRENQVDTVDFDEYSALVGAFVNDAKSQIEDSHTWSALRSTILINTVSGTSEYSITGSGNHPIIQAIVNDTSNRFITFRDSVFFNRAYYMGQVLEGTPVHFTMAGVDGSGDLKIKLYPQPDAAYALRVDGAYQQADLDSDATVMLIPANPVVQLAYAMALRERGESGGQSAQEQMIYADRVLSDYIAIDANYFPTETAFVVA